MKTRKWLWGLGLVAVLMIGAAWLWVLTQSYTFHGSVIETPMTAPNFTLAKSDGTLFRLGDYKGQVVILYFGYTSCPDVCPTTLSDLRQVRARIPRGTGQIKIVFITVDPERDSRERAQEYAAAFDASFIGLSGTVEELMPVWNAYGVYREKQATSSALGYLVDHSSQVYVIDKAGNLRETFAFGESPEAMAEDMNYLIDETRK